MNLHTIVKEFADSVVAQARAVDMGDANTNKYAERCLVAFKKIRAHGDKGRDALASLLSDERPEVRVMAAAFLLRHCEAKAKAVLEAEASGKGLTAFGAAQALERWKEGAWALDPKED